MGSATVPGQKGGAVEVLLDTAEACARVRFALAVPSAEAAAGTA